MTLHPGPSTLGRSVPWAAKYSGPPSTLGRPVPWAAQYPGPPTDPVDRAGVAVAGRVGQRRARAFISVVPGCRPGTHRVVALGVVVAPDLLRRQRPAQDTHLVDAPVKVPDGAAGIPPYPHRIGGPAAAARRCRVVNFHPVLVQPHPAAVVQHTTNTKSAKASNDLRAPTTPVVQPATAIGPPPRCISLDSEPRFSAINGFSASVIRCAPCSLPMGVLGLTLFDPTYLTYGTTSITESSQYMIPSRTVYS
jgi:hypothetical protein